MPSNTSFTIDVSKMERAERLMKSGMMRTLVARAGFKIEGESKDIAPFEFGTLKGSIRTTVIDKGVEAEAQIGPTVHYAIHHEFGTVKMRARPYMRPSLKKVSPFFVEWIKVALKRLA